jgi:hypothetical protein
LYIGYDKTAAENYVKKGSSAVDTPRSEQARQTRIDSLQKFIRSELSKLVTYWLLAIRLDLKMRNQLFTEISPQIGRRYWKRSSLRFGHCMIFEYKKFGK